MAKEYLQSNGRLLMTSDGELVQVPDSENLNDLADTNSVMATQSEEVTNEIEDLIVNGVIDGSPRGVYANLSALQTAYPSGAPGVYVTTDNGHWYYWNGTAWTDGGVYQAIEVPSEVTEAVNNINGLLYGEIMLDRVEYANNAYRDSENNLITTYYASKSALSQANKEIANLKEVLYGYVLDSTDVEINSVIPYTTTVGSNTYNLVDNAYGLIKEIRGNTVKNENLCSGYEQSSDNTWNAKFTLVNLKPNTTYYFKTNISGTVNSIVKLQNMSNQDVEVYHDQDYATNNNEGFTFTTGASINGTYKLYTQFGVQTEYHNKTADQVQARCYENRSGLNTDYRPYFTGLKSVEYNGLKVNGANLLNIADKSETTTNGITYSIKDGVITLNGTCTESFNINIGMNTEFNDVMLGIFGNIDGYVSIRSWNISWSGDSGKIYSNNFKHIDSVYNVRLEVENATYNNIQIKPMLVKGATAPTTYRPYKKTTILPFNTILRGVGSAKDKIVITKNTDNEFYTATSITNTKYFRLGSVKWSYNDGIFSAELPDCVTRTERTEDILCAKYSYSGDTSNDKTFYHLDTKLYVYDSDYTNVTDFKNAINDVWMFYELATPTTEVLSTTLTDSDVMPLLELGGSVEVVEDGELGSTVVEMVYRLSNTGV